MMNHFPVRGTLWAVGMFSALALIVGWRINDFINSQTNDSLMNGSGRYLIGMPEWKEHWLNYFISNMSYEVIDND